MEGADSRPGASSDSLGLVGLPWTSTRCHRLLRPLLTHISALRKEVDRQRRNEVFGDPSSWDSGDIVMAGKRWHQGDLDVADFKRPGLATSDGSLLWSQSRKRARHTYSIKESKRAKIREGQAEDPSTGGRSGTRRYAVPPEPNMQLTTPVVQRVRGFWSSPLDPRLVAGNVRVPAKSGRCHHSHQDCAKKCRFEDRLAWEKAATVPALFALYGSIYRAFDALLRATSTAEPRIAGPKSLMATCLRKVPDYLAALESWRLQELEEKGTSSALDDTNPSFDVYSDLQSLGMGKGGWKHLAVVVQSHGIRILKDAISEGLISDGFALILSDLCSELKPVSDRWQLLEAVVTQQYPKPRSPQDVMSPTAWSTSMPVLDLLAPPLMSLMPEGETELRMFKAKLTTDLLSNQLLPQEWVLGLTFNSIFSVAMDHLASRTSYYHTTPFFIATIQLYGNQVQQSAPKPLAKDYDIRYYVPTAQQSLINSLATLSTVVLLGQETMETEMDPTCRNLTSTVCRRAEYILRACLASAINSQGRPSRQVSTYALLLAVLFISENTTTTEAGVPVWRETQTLANFWARVEDNSSQHTYRQYYQATMALLASIAQGCTRKDWRRAAHTYLNKLCDKLDVACEEVEALRTIRVDAAFYLADHTQDLRDLHFAEQLAATIQAVANTAETPGRKATAFPGFRWDEGISEWVTVTPAVARRKQSVRGPVTRSASSGEPAPMQEAMSQPESSPLRASERIVDVDVGDVSNPSRDSRHSQLGTSAAAGTTCHPKRPRKQHKAQPTITTHGKAGVRTTTPRRRTRVISKQQQAYDGSGIDSAGDDGLDELRFDKADLENRLPSCKSAKSQRRRRSRRSLLSLRPVRDISNEYYGESSGDELGVL